MAEELGADIIGYPVMTASGEQVGTLDNITVDTRTGKLKSFLVTPSSECQVDLPTDEEGRLQIPVETFQSRDDYVLVDTAAMS